MSFDISVQLPSDDEVFRSPPDDAPAIDEWVGEWRELYSKPLGASGIVFRFWHSVAIEYGLTLIGSIYYSGLLRLHGTQLYRLAFELDRLKSRWMKMNLENEPPLKVVRYVAGRLVDGEEQPLREHLLQRAGYLATAIEIAQSQDALLLIC